jgi:hypothetical protein
MALQAETQAIVTQFDFSDENVNKAVREFLRQMGARAPLSTRSACALLLT